MINIFKLFKRNGIKNADLNDKNEVELCGKVVCKFTTDKICIITLKTNTVQNNFPQVLFFGDRRAVADSFSEGDAVYITGRVQSIKRNPEKPEHKTVSVLGESIVPYASAQRILLKKLLPVQNLNSLNVTGKIVNIYDHNNVVKFCVKTVKDKRISFVPIDYYYMGKNPFSDFKVGDTIKATGRIQTLKKQFEDEILYFENYVATDILRLSSASVAA